MSCHRLTFVRRHYLRDSRGRFTSLAQALTASLRSAA